MEDSSLHSSCDTTPEGGVGQKCANSHDEQEIRVSVAVSACLLGTPCRYDGQSRANHVCRALLDVPGVRVVPVCPEVSGGLKIPHPASEIAWENGVLKVVDAQGGDNTQAFVEGADKVVQRCGAQGCRVAVLKAKSPSCGTGLVYDGTFRGQLVPGDGVAAARLRQAGVALMDELQLERLMASIKAPDQEHWNQRLVSALESAAGVAGDLAGDASDAAGDEASEDAGAADEPKATWRAESGIDQVVSQVSNQTMEEFLASTAKESKPLPPITWQKFWGHLRTITKHKRLVVKYAFKAGIGAQGLRHDWSKYAPTEFWNGVRYFQGTRSPNAAERIDRGFTEAWMHHKGRNRHHYEYWLEAGVAGKLNMAPMPTRYVVEMLCDRVAACHVYQGADCDDGSALKYFMDGLDYVTMHPDSAALLLHMLNLVADLGEDAAFAQVKRDIVKPRWHGGAGSRW